MGVHHAWGRSLKDLFQRYHAALGEDQRYQNGFDCQGLWVEVEVEKALGLNSKHEIEAYGLDRFARACRDRVAEYSGVQTAQSRRLGMWMDWERSYYTMTDPNISYIWGFLKVCHERGWLYQGHRPMVWCLRCGTSLSQHEVTATDSYRDIVDPSLYVRFRFTRRAGRGARGLDDDALDAARERRRGGQARRRVRLGRGRRRAPRRREGSLRGGLRARRADRRRACAARSSSAGRTRRASTTCPRRPGSPTASWPTPAIVLDEGTGIVHIAPGCGAEDFEIGRREELPVLVPVDEAGLFVEGYGELVGHSAHEVPDLVVEHLERGGWLAAPGAARAPLPALLALRHEAHLPRRRRVVHPLRRDPPADDRRQRHGRVDAGALRQAHGGLAAQHGRLVHLAQALLGPAAAVLVLPGRAHQRRRLARRSCASARPPGLDGLHELHRPWIDPVTIACAECGAEAVRVPEVGDCWLDAGIVPFSTLGYGRDTLRARGLRRRRRGGADEGRPARPRLLGEVVPGRLGLGDARADPALVLLAALHVGRARGPGAVQARARATRSCTTSTAAPMHKSWGNAIWFDDAIEKIGADVSRWMFAGQDTART